MISARIGYFELGVNLQTEMPKPIQIKKAVDEVMNNEKYKQNVINLSKEFSKYDPNILFSRYLKEALSVSPKVKSSS